MTTTNPQVYGHMHDHVPIYLYQIVLGYDTTTGDLVKPHPSISQILSDQVDDYVWLPVHSSFDPETLQKGWDDPDE